MKKLFLTFLCFIFIPSAHAATSVPFTITMSEAVNVTGNPRIAVDVGGVTRYATYASGTGTSALTFTYTMVSGDVDNDGVVLSSPIDLNGGTITDNAGNPATLTFTPPDTSGVLINATVPSGYTAAFMDDTVTNVNKTNFGFTLNYNKANKTIHYSIASSGGGSPITGTATTTGTVQNITGMNVSALPDGKLTLSVYLTDAIGGTGATVTDTAPMAVLDASLVGHWTFDANDINGTTAYDRSGQNNNGTLTNGPTQVAGQVGGALNFDGVDDYITSSNASNLNPTNVTVSTWFRCNDIADRPHFVGKGNGSSGAYWLLVNPDGSPAFYYTKQGSSWSHILGSSGLIVANQIYMISGSYDGNLAKIYVNGNLINSVTDVGLLSTISTQSLSFGRNSGNTDSFSG